MIEAIDLTHSDTDDDVGPLHPSKVARHGSRHLGAADYNPGVANSEHITGSVRSRDGGPCTRPATRQESQGQGAQGRQTFLLGSFLPAPVGAAAAICPTPAPHTDAPIAIAQRGAPKRASTPGLQAADSRQQDDSDDDSIEVVRETGQVATRDFPHSRADCAVHRFRKIDGDDGEPANAVFCSQCYCYVCDVKASECEFWGTGARNEDHANAWPERYWSRLRTDARRAVGDRHARLQAAHEGREYRPAYAMPAHQPQTRPPQGVRPGLPPGWHFRPNCSTFVYQAGTQRCNWMQCAQCVCCKCGCLARDCRSWGNGMSSTDHANLPLPAALAPNNATQQPHRLHQHQQHPPLLPEPLGLPRMRRPCVPALTRDGRGGEGAGNLLNAQPASPRDSTPLSASGPDAGSGPAPGAHARDGNLLDGGNEGLDEDFDGFLRDAITSVFNLKRGLVRTGDPCPPTADGLLDVGEEPRARGSRPLGTGGDGGGPAAVPASLLQAHAAGEGGARLLVVSNGSRGPDGTTGATPGGENGGVQAKLRGKRPPPAAPRGDNGDAGGGAGGAGAGALLEDGVSRPPRLRLRVRLPTAASAPAALSPGADAGTTASEARVGPASAAGVGMQPGDVAAGAPAAGVSAPRTPVHSFASGASAGAVGDPQAAAPVHRLRPEPAHHNRNRSNARDTFGQQGEEAARAERVAHADRPSVLRVRLKNLPLPPRSPSQETCGR